MIIFAIYNHEVWVWCHICDMYYDMRTYNECPNCNKLPIYFDKI